MAESAYILFAPPILSLEMLLKKKDFCKGKLDLTRNLINAYSADQLTAKSIAYFSRRVSCDCVKRKFGESKYKYIKKWQRKAFVIIAAKRCLRRRYSFVRAANCPNIAPR
jgi:hypothetical protein